MLEDVGLSLNLFKICVQHCCPGQQCCMMLASFEQALSDLLRVCWPHQLCYKMITTCSRLVNNWEQAVRTHLVAKLRDLYVYSWKQRQ